MPNDLSRSAPFLAIQETVQMLKVIGSQTENCPSLARPSQDEQRAATFVTSRGNKLKKVMILLICHKASRTARRKQITRQLLTVQVK